MTAAYKVSAVFILSCLLLLVASSSVWAQDIRRGNVQDRLAAIRERIASKEAALKARLEQFRDQKKAGITERVSTNLNRINEKHTQMMLKFLDKASAILGRLEQRVNQGKPDIKDVAAAKTAIALAKESIASATAAVNTQAEKDYTITVTSESRVKTDAQTKRKQLHDDLLSVRRIVIAAKQAVANAIRVAKSGKVEIPGPSAGSGLEKEATESGQ